MRTIVRQSTWILAAMVALAACSKSADNDRTHSTVSGSAILNSDATPEEKAEELAKQAETLITAQGFLEASKVIEAALKEDSKNFRATFLQNMLAPVLASKGLMENIRPLMESSPATKAKYDEETQKIMTTYPKSNFRDFIFDGKADITTETQLQDRLMGVNEKLEALRVYLNAITVQEFVLKANSFFIPDLAKRFSDACTITKVYGADFDFQLTCPSSTKRSDITLNKADFLQLADSIGKLQGHILIFSAYDLTSLVASSKNLNDPNKSSAEQLYTEALKNPQFGKIKTSTKLADLKSIITDHFSDLIYITGNSYTLCPYYSFNPRSRPGKLYNNGICASNRDNGEMARFQMYSYNSFSNFKYAPFYYTFQTEPFKFLDNPIADVRDLGAMTFDKCGNLSQVTDKNFGVLFPNGDINTLLSTNSRGSCQ